jgi:hypothetical protein
LIREEKCGDNMIPIVECPLCDRQVPEAAIKVHNELNHAPKVIDAAAAKTNGDRLRTLGHYHKGRRGKCVCKEGAST